MKFRNDDELPTTGGAGNFIKLLDKESITGVFRGELHDLSIIWKDRKPMEVPEGTPNASFRFRVNFITKDNGVYVPKIFEQGVTVYRQLAELHKEYDLEKTVVKITRNGSGTDTTYSLLPLLKQTPTKEMSDVILLPLESKNKAVESDLQDDDLPF